MDHSKLLSDLARTAREEEAEEQQRWELWERLNDGALSAEEEAELQRLAGNSAEAHQAYEAFRPFGPDFRARVIAEIGPLGVQEDAAPVENASPVVAPVPEEQRRPIQVEKNRPWFTFPWWRPVFIGPGLAAAAAAVGLYLMLRPPIIPPPTSTEAALLDFDVARAEPGKADRRGETEGPANLAAGGTFSTSAQPATPLSVEIEPRCYVKPKPPPTRIRTADCAASDQNRGSLMIHGSLPEDLPAGPATLFIVLSLANHQPSADTIEKLPSDHPTLDKSWFADPQPIEILAP